MPATSSKVFDHITAGIAHAVSEYVRQRDAEFLRQANEHFAFVAHELRNPLSGARAAIHILEQRGHLPADDDVVRVLERAIQGTIELVDESLQAARMASGIELKKRWIKLSQLVRETELEMQMEARAKNQVISVQIQGDPSLHVDSRLVHSAIDNLLRNAFKYTPPGGSVQLRARAEAGHATLEVEDSCGGLPPGKVEEVFAPFVRLDRRKDGFGLGLAIARQAADAHGGTVRVQNLLGKGCVFALELPIDMSNPTTEG